MPKAKNKPPCLVVVVSGGNVQYVYADGPVDCRVIDFDDIAYMEPGDQLPDLPPGLNYDDRERPRAVDNCHTGIWTQVF